MEFCNKQKCRKKVQNTVQMQKKGRRLYVYEVLVYVWKILDNATPFAQRNLTKKKRNVKKLYIESKTKLRRSWTKYENKYGVGVYHIKSGCKQIFWKKIPSN